MENKSLPAVLSNVLSHIPTIEKDLTIEKIIETAKPISVLVRESDKATVKQALDLLVIRLSASFNMNLNLKDFQIKIIVEDLIEKYPNESIEDFALVFKKARQGEFGEVYRIDSAVIFGWMGKHLDQKYEAIERRLMQEKDKPYELPDHKPITIEQAKGYIDQMLENIKKIEVKAVIQPTKKEIKEEGQETPKQPRYIPDPEYAIMQILRTEWMRKNFHPITAQPLPGHLSFEEWLLIDGNRSNLPEL
jgi:hypothetical protein